ncbi:MAG: hypothetical protein ABL308_10265 [Oceanicaulis sp.]
MAEPVRSDAIEAYLKRLERALAALPDPERREIVEETRSHLIERAARTFPASSFWARRPKARGNSCATRPRRRSNAPQR